MIATLNPVIKGWAAYYRTVVSSRALAALDNHMWHLAYKWARHSHPNKSRNWVTTRYFDAFNRSRRDVWVFGDRDSGAYLRKFAWTKIVRHHMIKGTACPGDRTLVEYWAKRRRRKPNPLDRTGLPILQVQRGRCPLCGGLLLHADFEPQTPRGWEQWLRVVRLAIRRQAITVAGERGTPDKSAALRLIHVHCQGRLHRTNSNGPTLLQYSSAPNIPQSRGRGEKPGKDDIDSTIRRGRGTEGGPSYCAAPCRASADTRTVATWHAARGPRAGGALCRVHRWCSDSAPEQSAAQLALGVVTPVQPAGLRQAEQHHRAG